MNLVACKKMKKVANQKIRNSKNTDDIPNGRSYKKYFDSYDIVDACYDMRFYKEKPSWGNNHKIFKEKEKHQSWKMWK